MLLKEKIGAYVALYEKIVQIPYHVRNYKILCSIPFLYQSALKCSTLSHRLSQHEVIEMVTSLKNCRKGA
jgi:hypothetical protein